MKKIIRLVCLGVVTSLALRAQPFSGRLTPEEFRAAGLSKLTPEELVRLDVLFAKYVAPEKSPAARAEIDTAARVAAAEARALQAEREAAVARDAARVAQAEQKKAEDGFFA